MIVGATSVLIDGRTAAELAPVIGKHVRELRVRGPVPPALLVFAEECDVLRRAVAAPGNAVADSSPVASLVVDDAPMTIAEAARRYGISPRTLRHRCAQGRLGRREAGRWIVWASEVEAAK